ncbi:ISKra4 family transposase [Deinococcus sp. SM5_A1]|uniref:ISKra4 family transposase n=1 Tax=Deinococcus sp. SM5_A1 TaxID=3379094 RepID=UPI00385AA0FE
MKVELSLKITLPTGEVGEHLLSTLERDELSLETLGLSLQEGKALLRDVQQRLIEAQLDAFLDAQRSCTTCGEAHSNKGKHPIRLRTAFGAFEVDSPRWRRCACGADLKVTKTFSPLAALFTGHVHPELLYLETKWASLMSYGLTTALLHDVLPLDATTSAVTLRNHVLAVAKRSEATLGEERTNFIDGCPAQWAQLPVPDGPLTVEIDGGYVRSYRKPGVFEVIVGKSIGSFSREERGGGGTPPPPPGRCFGFVQSEGGKSRRRLFEHLRTQGMTANQHVVFLSDGGDTVRNLQLYLHPQAEHILDWFHVTMRLTVLSQLAKGLATKAQIEARRVAKKLDEDDEKYADVAREQVEPDLASIKHYLWHGNTFRALELIRSLEFECDVPSPSKELKKFERAVSELRVYINNNQAFIPNYGEKYHQGETITTAFVESTVNQVISKRMVKKQSMAWTPKGAHLLLQVRTRVLNDELEDLFREWHPAFRPPVPLTTAAPGI